MSIYKRGKTWWVDFTIRGERVQQTAGTRDKKLAQEYHDRLKAKLWRQDKLGEQPDRTWQEAVVKYLTEEAHKNKASYEREKSKLAYLAPSLAPLTLSQITRQVLDDALRKKVSEGKSPATLNRYVAVVRQVMRRAALEWEWSVKVPKFRTWTEDNERVRWLEKEELDRLLKAMNPHLARATRFALATGLRQGNVFGLEWNRVDLNRRMAWVDRRKMKTRKALHIPLNGDALQVLDECRNEAFHERWVFLNSKGTGPLSKINDKDWKRILKEAEIEDFRFHDTRHHWATNHLMNGTRLEELMRLGGWSTYEMVLRYAHLAAHQLEKAADRVSMIRLKEIKEEVDILE